MYKPALNLAILFAALAVVIGAFGAHALKPILTPEYKLTFETGVKYQFYHSIGLAFTGLLSLHFPSKYIKYATQLFSIGIVFFSGSLYALSLLQSTSNIGLGGIGILTPIGGLLLISAWICLYLSINTKRQ